MFNSITSDQHNSYVILNKVSVRVIKRTKTRAAIKRIYSKDEYMTRKTDTHFEHETTKITRKKKKN